MSFREKSLWVSLLISVVIASIYGDNVYQFMFAGKDVDAQNVAGLIIRVVIAFVILEIILHSVLAMKDQEGADLPEDERERNYRLRANNAGYWVLSIGVISCILQQMANSTFNTYFANPHVSFALAPIELKLVAIFWLSEMTRFATELYYYRKEG